MTAIEIEVAPAGAASPTVFEIEESVIARHPGVTVVGVEMSNVRRASTELGDVIIAKLWDDARAALASDGLTLDALIRDELLYQWREASTASGLKPSTYRSSTESLVRRVLKDGKVVTPVPVVTGYCAISSRYRAPIGVYDKQRIPVADITLRSARPASDHFLPLGGRAEDMPLTERVSVYAAGSEVMCWNFNHRDARTTAISTETDSVVVFAEGVTARGHEAALKAVRALVGLLCECGADAGDVNIASASTPRFTLTAPRSEDRR